MSWVRQKFLGEEGREGSAWNLLARVGKDLLRYKALLAVVAVSIIAYTLTALYAPYVLGRIIDSYIVARDVKGLGLMCFAYLALLVGQWASMTGNSYATQIVGQYYLRDLRNAVFTKLQRLSMKFFTERRIGDLVSATINDTSTLNDVLISGILSVLGNLISLVGIVAIMIYLSPSLTAVSLSVLPALVVIAKFFGMKLKEAHRAVRRKVAESTMIVEESISGVEAIKAFGREYDFLKSFAGISSETSKAYVRIAKLMGLFWPSMDSVVTLSVIIVMVFGAYLISINAATIGLVVAFIQYVNRLGRPITQFINMYDSLQAAIAAAERIYAIIDSEEVEVGGTKTLPLPKGEIEVRNVSFSYITGRKVLKNINLHIRPGETLAIVGKTGAGKTTLANLILRFYDPDEGEILLDGVNIKELKLDFLRKVISYVPQETYLFPGTVMDNIRLGRLDATDEEVVKVCRELGIHAFIEKLPKGYLTDAGEMGKKLSTGEKQLIAIARAMLRNPAIVILDEALSSVDPGTEGLVRKAMLKLMKGRTGILIAHRLRTAAEANRIIVIDEGEVVEEGTHEELMRNKGRYYGLWTSREGVTQQATTASLK